MSAQTSLQRVLTTLAHKEPDRVPLFLLLTMHGARELRCSIRDYFSRAESVVEGQLRLRAKYGSDCLYAFFHAALEFEAMGGEVIYREDGPPNAGAPLITSFDRIPGLRWPEPTTSPVLAKALETIRALKTHVGDEAPIIAVVISPFSMPVMQLGFERWLQLLLERPALLAPLMEANEQFCVSWANAQLAAGATAICYFDPLASPSMIPRELYLRTGHAVAKRTIAAIRGPTATHLASGRALPVLGDLAATGTAIAGVSALDDLAAAKAAARGRLTLLGNLNAVALRRWTAAEIDEQVRRAMQAAGPGGGFLLADNHGEIPAQVEDETLHLLADSARRWGRYPIVVD